jgi:hypothetical protein
LSGGHAVEFNAAAAGFRPHGSFCRSEVDAARAGIDFRRAADITELDAAASG